ncbi:hypothetical protein [Caballeronia sp. NCTM5]|uniref:hypothetical protein n=1 Tax=Caballeronia sp. NCTM5 TaxID=2921755 RepID=UPI0020280221|nr:hypothetical protein [Caballeronia sp. NCTM5]
MTLRPSSYSPPRWGRSPLERETHLAASALWRDPAYEYDKEEAAVQPQFVPEFRLFELPLPFVTPPDIILPAFDPYGFPHGEAYTPLLKARTPLMSTRAVIAGLKHGRLHQALSMNEFRILRKLAFFPYVVDFREQYGAYNRQAFWAAKARGTRMLRMHLTTIDVIVSYVLPADFQIRYHAISVKSPEYVPTEKDLLRERKERALMAARGWTWELMRGDVVSTLEFTNLRLLFHQARYQNLPELYAPAGEFAKVVRGSSNRGSLNAVMLRVARDTGISLDDAYARFSAAVAYGFLRVDHNYPLSPEVRLRLIR